jgi:hypothetical protein
MNDWTQKLILALVMVPTLLVIFGTPKGPVLVVAGSICVALAFANLDKIESFSSIFFEAKLRTAVEKAYAAIEQLKELGLSLSSPIVDEMAVSGRMLQYIPLKHKLERVEKIEDNLRKLGASKEEIEVACSTIYERVGSDHIRNVLRSLLNSNPEKKGLFEGLDDGKMDSIRDFEKFIKDNDLKRTKETDEALLDLQYFLKNKKLRREDQWQS